jgi:hypothetical protein
MHVHHVLTRCVSITISTSYISKLHDQLQGEPKLKYRRLLCMDGNDSLKRIRAIGQRQTADFRVFMESDYYIPREEVDKFANEVRGHVAVKSTAVSSDDQENEWEDVDDVAGIRAKDGGGDPTDGSENTAAIEGCVHNWKAAQNDSKKKSWEIFDENGLFASACRHGMILWIMDMVRSGEL